MKQQFILLFLLATCFAQTNFLRVFLILQGYPSTFGYFDYDPVGQKVIRVMYLNDDSYIMIRNSIITISSVAADDTASFGLLYENFNPQVSTYVLAWNHSSCASTQIPLPLAASQGLTLDPVNKYIYYNSRTAPPNVPLFYISRMNYDGTNVVSVFQDPSVNNSRWLQLDGARNRLLTSLVDYELDFLNVTNGNVTTISRFPSTGCQNNIACDISYNVVSVDSSTGIVYYPDSSGVISFNPSTGVTTRVVLTPLQTKNLIVDSVYSLLFIQLIDPPIDPIYFVKLNLPTGTANGTLTLVSGITAASQARGNILSVAHCTTSTCGNCGLIYGDNVYTTVTYAGASQLIFSLWTAFLFLFFW